MRHSQGMRVAAEIVLTSEERELLVSWAARLPEWRAVGAQIVLRAARGWRNERIARDLGVGKNRVGRWRTAFVKKRLACFERPSAKKDNPHSLV